MGERSERKNEGFLDKLRLYREASTTAEALEREEGDFFRAVSESIGFLQCADSSDERSNIFTAGQAAIFRLRDVQNARIEAAANLSIARQALESIQKKR